ncbi:MAG: thioredoxin family protein [Gammaproteobacteria bacterium]|nr:thioredoxin family protein [Gammaproteobacteria bacterium]
MAISSSMLELGTQAPDFNLPEPLTGNQVALADFAGKPLLVAFICNHCPYVILIREELAKFAREYQAKGLAVVAINANDIERYPDDDPQNMMTFAKENDFSFPYLFDETQQTAKAYKAACTPDFFLFGADGKLFYRGQFDSARPNSQMPVTGADLRRAADALLAGDIPPDNQLASLGCGIKWKEGNEPDYFV